MSSEVTGLRPVSRDGYGTRNAPLAENMEAEMPPAKLESFEDILKAIGTNGRRNYFLLFLCLWTAIFAPFQAISYQFLGMRPSFWCRVDPLMEANWSQDEIRQLTVPLNDEGKHEGCFYYDLNMTQVARLGFAASMESRDLLFNGGINKTVFCSSRIFDPEVAVSVTSQWDLVCDRLAIYSATHSMGQVGALVGSFSFGYLLDLYGRRQVMMSAAVAYLVAGVLTAISLNVVMYMVMRILVAGFGFGVYVGGFVLGMELCVTSQRSAYGALFAAPWAIGYMLVPFVAYLVRPWRWLQTALTLPVLMFLPYYWLLPESPRWLLLNNRLDEALEVLKKIADSNGRPMPDKSLVSDLMLKIQKLNNKKSSVGLCAKIRTSLLQITALLRPPFVWLTLSVFFSWLSVSFVYYGVSLSSVNIGANIYWYTFFGGLLELVSYLLLWPLLHFMGRKKPLIILFLLCAVSIFGVMTSILVDEKDSSMVKRTLLSLLGKFAITAAFQLIYVMTAELYPTVYRSLAVGQSSVCARVGSAISPFVNDLLGNSTRWAPSALFGGFSLLAGLMAAFIPETGNTELRDWTHIETRASSCSSVQS